MHGLAPPETKISLVRRPKRRFGRLMLGGAAMIVLGGVALFLTHLGTADSDTLVIASVTRGDIEETVTATGKIQPHAYVDVGAQASGQLNRILVHIGDFVKQGQLLAEIDPQVEIAKVEADDAQLAQYNANLVQQLAVVEYNEAQYGRMSKLNVQDSISKSNYDEARRDAKEGAAQADAIRAEIRQMQSTLKADQVTLGYTKIFAPMSGTVVSIDAREGQTLNAAYSTPQILRIADLATMTVWTQVSEADVTRLKVGMPVYFTTLGYEERRWNAKLRQILPAPQKPPSQQSGSDSNASASSSPENNVVLYTALFDIDNTAGDLRPEMTAQVFFVAASAKNAVIAPAAALHSSSGDEHATTVTVLDASGQDNERKVETGLGTRFQAQILSGLVPGDRVVIGQRPGSGKSSLVGFHL